MKSRGIQGTVIEISNDLAISECPIHNGTHVKPLFFQRCGRCNRFS